MSCVIERFHRPLTKNAFSKDMLIRKLSVAPELIRCSFCGDSNISEFRILFLQSQRLKSENNPLASLSRLNRFLNVLNCGHIILICEELPRGFPHISKNGIKTRRSQNVCKFALISREH